MCICITIATTAGYPEMIGVFANCLFEIQHEILLLLGAICRRAVNKPEKANDGTCLKNRHRFSAVRCPTSARVSDALTRN
jgi:hypothetical protein